MHSADVVRKAHALAAAGATQTEIASELCIGQTTVSRWLRQGPARSIDSPMRHRAMSGCPHACTIVDQAPKGPYAYLLGQYLGDGSIVRTKRGVYRLFITCCAAYPGIIDECVGAINAVLPENAVGRRAKRGAVDVNCYDRLGIEWRVMNRYDIAVSRRASVSKLDTIVGPKT